MADTLKLLISQILDFTEPVNSASLNKESLRYFFKGTGWNFDENSGMPLANIVNAIGQISQKIQTCQELIESEDAESLEKVFQLLSALQSLFKSVSNLVDSFDGANLNDLQIEEVTTDLLHYLTTTYLLKKLPTLSQLLFFIEVIQIKKGEETQFNNAGKIIRFPYQFAVLNFDNLGKFIQNPVELFKSIYITPFDRNTVSGAKDFTDKLFPRIGNIASSLGAISVYGIKPAYGINFGTIGNEMASGALTIKIQTPLDEIKAGATVIYSPRDREDLGWVIVPFGEVTLDQVIDKYYFSVNSVLNVGGIIIGNDGNVSFKTSNGLTSVFIDILAKKLAEEDTGVAYLIGDKEGTRLEIGSLSIGSKLGFSTEKVEFDFHFDFSKSKFVISSGGQDSFIAKMIPSAGLEVPFDFLLGYSSVRGLYFNANSNLEIEIPVHSSLLNILTVDIVCLKIIAHNTGIKAETSVNGKSSLGPLKISFKEVGLQANLDWKKQSKNLGFADFDINFKPPTGVALAVNTEGVTGGGFLAINTESGEYRGGLVLSFKNLFTFRAIAIINTKLPGGQEGFSLFVMITGEFQPVQLGFGFTLNGVGGLFGYNRTVEVDKLNEMVRSGQAALLLFPPPSADLPTIVNTAAEVYPVKVGNFVFGPMGKIGWGTPTIISAEIALIVEVPDPVRIGMLGVIRVVLPDPKLPTIRLNMVFFGLLDFAKKEFSLQASLFESSVLTMTLSGDFAMIIAWGQQPMFILSAGGFHPSYKEAPPRLVSMRRLALTLIDEENLKIGGTTYLAITSNTAQFGAKIDLWGRFGDVKISGKSGFDVLFQFNPFRFQAELYAGVEIVYVILKKDVKIAKVDLYGSLNGPGPWFARGEVCFSGWFGEVRKSFEHTWGEVPPALAPETVDVRQQLAGEVQKKENWQSTPLPGTALSGISVRDISKEPDIVLMPNCLLTFRQKLVPLGIEIQKFGEAIPVGGTIFNIEIGNIRGKDVQENFARANFLKLSSEEKLSYPSFEKFTAGTTVELGNNGLQKANPGVPDNYDYELKYLSAAKKNESLSLDKLNTSLKKISKNEVRAGASYQSALSLEQNRPGLEAVMPILITEQFIVVKRNNLEKPVEKYFRSYTEAEQYRKATYQNPKDYQDHIVISTLDL